MKCFIQLSFALSLLLVLTACGGEKIETNMSSEIAEFTFTTQDEESFGLDELEGEWWISYFFYTNCKMVCPRTTAHMVTIQEELTSDGLTPPIVGFSVDPDFDTPEVLQDYGAEYDINFDNFTLLSGYDFQEIRTLSNESFKTVLEDGGPEDHAYAHSTFFFLVNPDGELVKRYDGLSLNEIDELIDDVKKVL